MNIILLYKTHKTLLLFFYLLIYCHTLFRTRRLLRKNKFRIVPIRHYHPLHQRFKLIEGDVAVFVIINDLKKSRYIVEATRS